MPGESVKISPKRLADFRINRLFFSQEELARELKISSGRIGGLEQGMGGMSLKTFRKLAEIAKIPPEELRALLAPQPGEESDAPDEPNWDDMVESSGTRITEAREAKGMSEEDLAKAIDMDPIDVQGFSKFPTGAIPRHIFNRIAQVLGVSPQHLESTEEERKNQGTTFWIMPMEQPLIQKIRKYAEQEGMEPGFFAAKLVMEAIEERKKRRNGKESPVLKIQTAGEKNPGRPVKKAAKPRQT